MASVRAYGNTATTRQLYEKFATIFGEENPDDKPMSVEDVTPWTVLYKTPIPAFPDITVEQAVPVLPVPPEGDDDDDQECRPLVTPRYTLRSHTAAAGQQQPSPTTLSPPPSSPNPASTLPSPSGNHGTNVERIVVQLLATSPVKRIIFENDSTLLTSLQTNMNSHLSNDHRLSADLRSQLEADLYAIDDFIARGSPRFYEDDEVSPWRELIFPFIRRLLHEDSGILNDKGKTLMAQLRPDFLTADQRPAAPADKGCYLRSTRFESTAPLFGFKRLLVAEKRMRDISVELQGSKQIIVRLDDDGNGLKWDPMHSAGLIRLLLQVSSAGHDRDCYR